MKYYFILQNFVRSPAQRSGVDEHKVQAALLDGFAGSKIGQRMPDHNLKPGLKVALHQKDMRIVVDAARQINLPLRAAALAMQRLNILVERGEAELDFSAVFTVVQQKS
jgi:3-hydroxyisobutyrate dehydrogenase-like beta-hydroxyacid dehydrogenase